MVLGWGIPHKTGGSYVSFSKLNRYSGAGGQGYLPWP